MSNDFYEIKTAATSDPVDFDDASDWCRDLDSSEQTLVESLITAATGLIESMTNRIFVSRTFTGYFSSFRSSNYDDLPYVEIKKSPLLEITSVTVNGTVLDDDDYILKRKSSFSRILFTDSYTLDYDYSYPIEIEFTAGYETVPDAILTAIKQLVLFWYENRGDVSTEGKLKLPLVTRQIIKQYRIVSTYG